MNKQLRDIERILSNIKKDNFRNFPHNMQTRILKEIEVTINYVEAFEKLKEADIPRSSLNILIKALKEKKGELEGVRYVSKQDGLTEYC